MLTIVDADSILFAAAFAAQRKAWSIELDGETLCIIHNKDEAFKLAQDLEASVDECHVLKPEAIAKWYADQMLRGIVGESYQLYLSPSKTFRNKYEDYKANRTADKPHHYEAVKNHLIEKWGAWICEDIEADDQLSLIGWGAWRGGDELPLLVHQDKDILQVPGFHLDYRKNVEYYVTEYEARRNFWESMLVGDTADNIKGIYGIGPVKARKILDGSDDWEQVVREMYEKEGLNFDKNWELLKLLEE